MIAESDDASKMVAPMHPVRSLVSSGGSVAQPFLPIPLPTTRILVLHSRTYSRTRHSMYHQPRIIRTALCALIGTITLFAMILASCDESTPVLQTTVSIAATTATPTPTIALPSLSRYETGMVAPAWNATGYSSIGTELTTIKHATDARWVELPVLLSQSTPGSTDIRATSATVTPQSLRDGIESAHLAGLRVFVVPLLGVQSKDGWAGVIQPSNVTGWFSRFWQAWRPYVEVAQEMHADQLAIGTEAGWLQNHASPSLWTDLIGQVSGVYHGRITYDSNCGDLYTVAPSWMSDIRLAYIGVSEYISLVDTPSYASPGEIAGLWKLRVQGTLDDFSQRIGKRLIISEIGYRATSDALYHAYATTSGASASQDEQAAAYDAALTDLQDDSHIDGVFPWAWTGGDMGIAGKLATGTLRQHYV